MTIGAGAFNVQHHKGSNASGGLLREALRATEEGLPEKWAQEEEKIHLVPEDSHLNVDLVNVDGQFIKGSIADAEKRIAERLDLYGRKKLREGTGKRHKGSTTTLNTFISYAPEGLLEEVPNYYEDGESRWVPRDMNEVKRYLFDVASYISREVVPGGLEAVHVVSFQFDETRPHVHIIGDPFMEDEAGKLVSGQYTYFGGEDSKQYVKKGVRSAHMAQVQSDFKKYLQDKGWPVESEPQMASAGPDLPTGAYRKVKQAEKQAKQEAAEAKQALQLANEKAKEAEKLLAKLRSENARLLDEARLVVEAKNEDERTAKLEALESSARAEEGRLSAQVASVRASKPSEASEPPREPVKPSESRVAPSTAEEKERERQTESYARAMDKAIQHEMQGFDEEMAEELDEFLPR